MNRRAHSDTEAEETWWKKAVVYQIYPRSFADSDGDGIGDLRGIISKLDHLSALGVDVIWLSPVYPSPQDDNGYDISDYQDIEPTFGNAGRFRRVVGGRARPWHETRDGPGGQPHLRRTPLVRAVALVGPTTRNATGTGGGPPGREWPPGTPGAEPTNWASFFSGSAWKFDESTGEYYLHLFSRKQPDLNWENPEVAAAVYEMMRWWLDRGVDGFRMDVINMISKDTSLPDGSVTARRTVRRRLAVFPVRPAHS